MKIDNVSVIGVGGSGQALLPSLMRMLKYHPNGTEDIVAFDGDDFEDHNGERQIHTTGTKADRMNDLLQIQQLPAICRSAYVSASMLRTWRQRDAESNATRMVVATVDNDATRKACIDALIDNPGDFLFVSPGNSDAQDPDKDINGNVLWFGRVAGQDYGINPALLFPNIEKPMDAIPRKGSCISHAVSHPQLIAANALAASLTLTVIQGLLDDRMPVEASNVFFSGRKFQLTAN